MKTRLHFLLSLALGLAVLVAPQVKAQSTAFTYQGRLNSGSNFATGLFDLTFTLFSVAGGAGQVGTPITNSASAITNGLFTATLDFGVGMFPGANRWLEVGVRSNGAGAFTILSPRQGITATPYAITASNITGLVPATSLAGTYSSVVTLNNAGNSFSGSGAGLTSLNANNLGSGTVPDARLAAGIARISQVWLLAGNLGTTPGTHFLGTRDSQALEIKVNNTRALRLEPNGAAAPNVIGGSPDNLVAPGGVGSTIAGGSNNFLSGHSATISGGAFNTNIANISTIGGGYMNTISVYGATVGGGELNDGSGSYATVAGGRWNSSTADGAALGGGIRNNSGGDASTVGGGDSNVGTGDFSTLGGGRDNYNTGGSATIAGGDANTNSGNYSSIGGGLLNTISGFHATVPGGHSNSAVGNLSFAAGNRAKANHNGAFVWGDSQNADVISTATNQFIIRAGGGVGIGATNLTGALFIRQPMGLPAAGMAAADNGLGLGQYLTNSYKWIQSYGGSLILNPLQNNVGINKTNPATALDVNGTVTATAFNPPSDRNLKENFTGVSPREVLDKVAALHITRWNFKSDAATPHLGPMAQDFHAAFKLGTDERHIATVDADGVALAAIQGLNQKLEERLKAKDAEIEELRRGMETLKQLVIKSATPTKE